MHFLSLYWSYEFFLEKKKQTKLNYGINLLGKRRRDRAIAFEKTSQTSEGHRTVISVPNNQS